ncbi:meiotic nuclear division protein 1 homolog [Periplaneta americana]|uniref:meiotic nuclear division protein 1 homolog n=1 Tax=Periplaneta americana TaxID=6978 RepID=UPI0037E7F4BA
MSKRKGVSAEEKRTRMLQIFYEKKEFFQLKELERIAPKEKGIIAQSVKDVLQSLVDDGLVDSEKIGTSVYFWAFPSKAKHSKIKQVENAGNRLNEVTKKLKTSQENVAAAKIGREPTEERTQILEKVAKLKSEEELLLKEIQKYKDSDPEVMEKMKNQTQVAKEAANRWTDNIFSIKAWCKNKFFIEENVLNKQFGIDPEMDYLD